MSGVVLDDVQVRRLEAAEAAGPEAVTLLVCELFYEAALRERELRELREVRDAAAALAATVLDACPEEVGGTGLVPAAACRVASKVLARRARAEVLFATIAAPNIMNLHSSRTAAARAAQVGAPHFRVEVERLDDG